MSKENTEEFENEVSSDDMNGAETNTEHSSTDEQQNDTENKAEETNGQDVEELDEQEARIQELENELAAAKDATLRKAAELENVRKRVKRERIQIFEEAKAGALEDFMPIYDDLLRSLKAAEESKVEDSFLEGVKMVSNKFQEVLNKHNVERIDETGVPFDVNLHDAMMKQKAEDEDVESDTVLQVLESGYKIGDRTIRHAKVIVSE